MMSPAQFKESRHPNDPVLHLCMIHAASFFSLGEEVVDRDVTVANVEVGIMRKQCKLRR